MFVPYIQKKTKDAMVAGVLLNFVCEDMKEKAKCKKEAVLDASEKYTDCCERY